MKDGNGRSADKYKVRGEEKVTNREKGNLNKDWRKRDRKSVFFIFMVQKKPEKLSLD